MPVSFVAVRQGSGILLNSMLIIASVRISDFDALWKKTNSLKYPPGNSVWSMSCRHSAGGLGSRSRANVTSMCRARALRRTRGDAHVIGSGKAFDHSPDMSVVKLVGRHEVPDCPYPLQLACERLIKFDWRVEEEVVIREAHDRHPRSERQRQPDSTH